MSRYLYSNLLKIVFGLLLGFVFISSFSYLICSLLIDNHLNVTSLILTISCIALWAMVIVVINVLNKIAKAKIVFEEGKIRYKDRIMYANNVSIKYFKFHISITDPSLIIPKIHINGNNLAVTCYLSKKDIKRLKKLNFKVKEI